MTAKKKYSFDDHPEHRAQLDEWAQRWIANALSTEPADRDRMRVAMRGLYEAANLAPPARGVFVQSPMTAAVAGGVAAGVWWLRENPSRHVGLFGRVVSEGELRASVPLACARVVVAGMEALGCGGTAAPLPIRPGAATGAATWAATEAATWAATDDATRAATRAATEAATWAATRAATEAADVAGFLAACTQQWWRMHNGGSDWSGWPAYLSFSRHVAGLDLSVYDRWRHYEDAARYGASRIMHQKFWIVADRQTLIRQDTQRRPHSEHGPARAWGDGWAVFYWHGVLLPADPDEIRDWPLGRVLGLSNAEVRRCAIEIVGWDRLLEKLKLVAECDDPGNAPHKLGLYDLPKSMRGMYAQPARILLCTNGSPERDGTVRRFGLPVPAAHSDPVAAAADLVGWPVEAYRQLEFRR